MSTNQGKVTQVTVELYEKFDEPRVMKTISLYPKTENTTDVVNWIKDFQHYCISIDPEAKFKIDNSGGAYQGIKTVLNVEGCNLHVYLNFQGRVLPTREVETIEKKDILDEEAMTQWLVSHDIPKT